MPAADSFSVLLQTEEQAAKIIKEARDKRKTIRKEYDTALTEEIAQYKAKKEGELNEQQTAAKSTDGATDKEDEEATQREVEQIRAAKKKNMPTMQKLLIDIVTTVSM